jgi:hypothetical protein
MNGFLERHKNYLKYLLLLSLISLVILFVAKTAQGAWYDASWQYRKQITIKGSQVAGGPHASFPVLIQLASDADLASDAQDDGDDILFTSSDETTKIPHEIESFSGSTGALVAWVKVDLNANPVDTVIYMYYGYGSASNQQSATNVWSDYKGVWHLNEVVSDESTSATHYDSTSNHNNGTQHNNNDTTGKIGRGQDFDGDDDYISVPSNASLQPTTALTLSGWIKLRSFGSGDDVDPILRKGEDNNNNYQLIVDDGKAQLVLDGGDGDTILGSTTLSANSWYYIVGTWQSGGQRRVYLNGVQNGSTGSFTGPIGTDTRALYMGGRASNDYSDSTLDEVRISKTYHSAQWIQTEYNNQNNPANFIIVGLETAGGGSNNPPNVDAGPDQNVTLPNLANLDGTANDGGDGPTNPPSVTWTKQSGPGTVTFGNPNAQDTTAEFSIDGIYVLRLEAYDGADTAYDEVTITVYPAGGPPPVDDYTCNMKITIDHTKVSGTSDLAYFPVLISLTDDTLKNTGCGFVTSSDGDDIIFTNESKTLQLDHEIEKYDGSTGALVAWVKIPTLSVSTDTVIYAYYGNSNVTTPQENPTGVWDSNYKSVWHLKEDPSTTAPQMRDSTSNGNHGTSRGTMTSGDQVSGKIGGSLDFDGGNDYVYTTNSFNNPQNFTLSAWFKTGSASGKRVAGFESTQTGTGSSHWDRHLYVGTDGKVYFGAYSEADDSTDVAVSTNTLNDNNWHYVVGIRDDAADRVRLYVDGNLNDSTYNRAAENFSGWWRIGSYMTSGWPSGQDGYFPGVIDEVRVSNTVRSADWIKTEYNNQSNPSAFYSVEKNCPETVPQISEFACSIPITIDSSKVSGTTDLINFPVLISLTNNSLKSTANCGYVQNSNGYDIIFSNASQTTRLDHEIEKYDSASGQLVAWVRIPILSVENDTTIYVHFGHSGVCGSLENPTGVWDSNYKAVWHLHDDFEDSTSNNNDGTNSGTTSGTGKIANSRSFNGSSNYIRVGDSASLTVTSQLTMEAWVNLSNAGNNQKIVGKTNSTYSSGYLIGVQSGLYTEIWNTQGTNHTFNSGSISSSQWTHLVTTWTTGGNMIGYINGSQVNSISAGGYNIGTNAGDLIIGAAPWNPGSYLVNGRIDEVRVSNTARSADWIKTEYNNQSDPSSFYSVGASSCFLGGFSCNRKITIPGSNVSGSGNLTDFPVLIKIENDCNLKTVANGGHIQDSNGYDIVFTDASGATQLDHETEEYDGVRGDLTAWVKIPTLYGSSDTDIYMYYGKSGLICDPSNPVGVWSNSYRGVWHLHDTSGDTRDSTSYNTDGVLSGSITRGASGEIDNAFDFSTNAQVSWGDPGDGHLDAGTGSWTVSLWANVDVHRTGEWEQYIKKGADSWGRGYNLEVDGSSNIFHFNILDANYSEWGISAPDIPFSLDTWTYLVGVVDRSNNRLRAYKDGVQIGSGTGISGFGSLSTGSPLLIGCDTWGWPDGLIEELRISNTARSADWIKTEYDNQRDPAAFSTMGNDSCGGQYGFNYQYCKKITVDHTQVNSDLSNFPLLVQITGDDDLKTVANGGRVYHSLGYDIVFRSPSCGQLDHEIEKYDGSAGTLIAWVRVPTLSASTDTEIYMYYGDSSVTCSPENPPGVWDSNYRGVWHLHDDLEDSTSNNNDGTGNGPTNATGKIADAESFDGDRDYISVANNASLNVTSGLTMEAWVRLSNADSNQKIVGKVNSAYTSGYLIGVQTRLYPEIWNNQGSNHTFTSGSISSSQWTHLATTWTTGGNMIGYINGSQVNSISAGSYDIGTNSVALIIGAAPWNTSTFEVNGRIDEVRVSATARSADWIMTEYKNQNDPGNFYSISSCFEQTMEVTEGWEEEVQ